jgi:hypothetical protein
VRRAAARLALLAATIPEAGCATSVSLAAGPSLDGAGRLLRYAAFGAGPGCLREPPS